MADMPTERGHRKRVRHYDEPGHLHELTFSCYRQMSLLTNDVWRAMLSVSIDRAVKGHGFRLIAFVFMPEAVQASMDYIHMNPVRRGLVDEARLWRWSSCRWYIEEGQCRDEALPTVQGCPAEFWDSTQ